MLFIHFEDILYFFIMVIDNLLELNRHFILQMHSSVYDRRSGPS